MKRVILATAVSTVLALGTMAHATVLAEWTFEVSVPTTAGPHEAEGGVNASSSFASASHASSAAVYSNPVGNGSMESFSSNNWGIGDYYQFTTSTLGFTDITFGWDQTRSSTGPGTFDLQYSTDGTSFSPLVTDYTIDALTWSSNPANHQPGSVFGPVSAPSALDNQANVYFRLVNKVDPGGAAGANRVDNIIITGVPEPATLALLGLGACLLRRRRR